MSTDSRLLGLLHHISTLSNIPSCRIQSSYHFSAHLGFFFSLSQDLSLLPSFLLCDIVNKFIYITISTLNFITLAIPKEQILNIHILQALPWCLEPTAWGRQKSFRGHKLVNRMELSRFCETLLLFIITVDTANWLSLLAQTLALQCLKSYLAIYSSIVVWTFSEVTAV